MSSIDLKLRASLAGLWVLAGCSSSAPPAPSGVNTSAANVALAAEPSSRATSKTGVPLPPPKTVRSWAEVRLQAAHRLVAANPEGSYTGEVPEPLLGIPVLEIELNGDGSVRKIVVIRHPQEAKDTSRLAEAAVHRAAPFGDVSRLPKPWRFTETFLFNDDRKFKPRTLDP